MIALVALCSGCGPRGPETAEVAGKVTYGGQPVPEGTITFYPERGRPASGRIRADGSYRLTTFAEGDGALLGRHTVTIEAVRFAGAPEPKSMEEEVARALEGKGRGHSPPKPEWLVPQRYSQRGTSGLEAEVKPGCNSINFDLPGE